LQSTRSTTSADRCKTGTPVERCRYVTQHIKFDLVPFHGISNVSFVYNTPMPAAMLSSSFS
jgi:hypothetical protein